MFGVICAGRPVETSLTPLSDTQLTLTIPSQPAFNHLVVFLLPGSVLPPDTGAAVYIQFPPQARSSQGPTADSGVNAAETPPFKFLGALGVEKQSAIFRINNSGGGLSQAQQQPNAPTGADDDVMVDDDDGRPPSTGGSGPVSLEGNITLGISIEPAASITAQVEALKSSSAAQTATTTGGPSFSSSNANSAQSSTPQLVASRTPPTKLIAQRIIKNAFNFISGFVSIQPQQSSPLGGGNRSGEEVVPLKAFREWWMKFEKKVDLDPGFLERDDD